MAVQLQYQTNAQRGYVGDVSRAAEPHAIDLVPVQVPANGRNPRPGDPVYWDGTNNGAAVPTTDNQSELVIGIVTYYPDQVAGRLSAIPSGSNSDAFIEYTDGQVAPILVMGSIWLLAGGAIEYHQLIRWDTTNFDWETVAKPTAFTDIIAAPVTCVDIGVADTDIFQGRIGYGRVF